MDEVWYSFNEASKHKFYPVFSLGMEIQRLFYNSFP